MQKRARRLGVMGGTFDPIHYGHLVAASEVADLFDLDEVVFVPSGQPWQKSRDVSAAEDRYLMTVIATASNPRFSVSRVDIDRGGPTYTKDTLSDLHALNPDTELFFITGADALSSILSWQGWEGVFELARFIGVSRPGYELRHEHITEVLGDLATDALTLVEVPALAISSTDCRQRAAQRRPLWYLMPDGVVQYVSKRRLYRGPVEGEAHATLGPTQSSMPAGNNT
ncbi:nicotinate-nucleotide adenylyltransferase [Mycobacterium montefiorense]|uniref:Probable nicotinate-nucleotide adenylyltransferase n=1 Tax=Mycobacterium montefiorense TaxID=154654 RepID=A0AA37PIL0_9MYCO|nr:nicotinate-nucleotide adenylyltransferase [Mycobacterium montefiorense]GBG39940.1 putative nicotinate-nucleotide adenylyltransferase [Mycobacterium montefiorense]GKU43750.1 putative nicotinate-nucleotide adenylyltransferase [Mycobacterium montefiorense]GKU67052.1 putative nicotinate-nucleotide adenylyltransferase [Mycobacterium montefiorense]GKU70477.1 putative nicotinate-nucleotide adenylyltransferase [Mycobacterium montefiorense]